MEIIRGVSHIRRFPRPVVAIGIFDGMHTGHTAIIRSCVKTAAASGGTGIVLTFEPHPQKEQSIYSLEHRLAIMERLGVKACILIRFTRAFSQLSARAFIKKVIARSIGARRVMVGENFRFGRGLEGDVSTLRECGLAYGFATDIFPLCLYRGKPVSSTRIRACIQEGRLGEARRMLGRPVSVFGTVVEGRRVGRLLGCPTANILPRHEVLPPDGIYAVKALVSGKLVPAICYKGRRPSFGGGAPSIEVHLFGFRGNLYGKTMEVFFFKRLRGDRKFASFEELRRAIRGDISAAKKILSST
jgi:riboflavin kinase/FMN adenylyltransferase